MANFAMTPEEERLEAMYGSPTTPYATYVEKEDPFQKFIREQKAIEEKRALASVGGEPQPPPIPVVDNEKDIESATLRELKRKMQAAHETSRAGLQSGVDQLQKQYDDYGQNQETDISGLLGAMDVIGGGNALSKYKAPPSEKDIAEKKIALGQILQKAKEGVSDADLARLKQMYDMESEKRNAETSARDARAADAFGVRVLQQVEQDPVVKKATSMAAAAGDVDALVDSNNPIGHASIPTFVARLSGEVGALSEADKAPFGSSRQFEEKLSQILSTYADTGLLTPPNMKYLKDLSSTLKRSATSKTVDRKGKLLKQYGRAQKRFGESDLRVMMGLDQDELSLYEMKKATKTPPSFNSFKGK